MIMIYDVDQDMTKEEVVDAIAIQNPSLGLSQKEAGAVIKPTFKRGPRDTDNVWWVCQVRPDYMARLSGTYLYIGMCRCRTKEYLDWT